MPFNFFNVTAAACRGSPEILTGTNGVFGLSSGQYGNKMTCAWKIQVETGKVNVLILII